MVCTDRVLLHQGGECECAMKSSHRSLRDPVLELLVVRHIASVVVIGSIGDLTLLVGIDG